MRRAAPEVKLEPPFLSEYFACEDETRASSILCAIREGLSSYGEGFENAVVEDFQNAFRDASREQQLMLTRRAFSLVGTFWVPEI